MANPTGESESDAVRLDFDRRLMLQFRGSVVTYDAGLLAYRELDDVLGFTEMAGDVLADARSGNNGRRALARLFRQSVCGRLAGYEDVNDAERLRHDPAMHWIVGGKAAQSSAASPSQMGRFETQWLAAPMRSRATDGMRSRATDGMSASECQGKRPDQAVKHRSDGRECREPSTLSHLGFQPVQKTPTIHVSSGFIWGIPDQSK